MSNAFQSAVDARRKREAEQRRLERMAAQARAVAVSRFREQFEAFAGGHGVDVPVETRGDAVLIGTRDDGIRATAASGAEFILVVAASYAGDVWERKRDANRRRVSFDEAAAEVVEWLHESGRMKPAEDE